MQCLDIEYVSLLLWYRNQRTKQVNFGASENQVHTITTISHLKRQLKGFCFKDLMKLEERWGACTLNRANMFQINNFVSWSNELIRFGLLYHIFQFTTVTD